MDIYPDRFELSQPQKSIWYLEQKYSDTCMNVIAGTLRLKGRIDYAALAAAIQLTIKNNDGLRIHFREDDTEASQFLTPYTEKEVDFLDFSQGRGLEDLYEWDKKLTNIPFNIIDSDLFYFAVFKIDEQNGGAYAKFHHLISDAWTICIMANGIMEYYSMLKNNIPFEDVKMPSFFEHLINERAYESSDRFLRDKEYWNSKFENLPEPTVLKPQALNTESTRSNRKTFITPHKFSDKIHAYCAANNASVFTLFMSALSIYIHRVTENEDIVLGTTILNRINAREKQTVGMFVSVAAPIRIQMNDSQNFAEFSAEMLKECVAIFKHQKYPYNYLIRDLKGKHKLSNRLFDIVLNYQNSKIVTKKSDEDYVTRWHSSGHQVESLIIHVNDRDDEGHYIIDYDYLTDVYHSREIEDLHQHVMNLLWHALDNPQKLISRLEMLSEKEKNQILCQFNNTAADYPEDKTLHQFLYEQAAKTPEMIAVRFGVNSLTYLEVNEKSNQLARILCSKGVKADTVVGISLYRSFEMIIGVMAILKAGGAYLPIDPNYPQDRIEYMMNNSGARILLTQSKLAGQFTFGADVICIDGEGIYSGDSSDLGTTCGPDSLAYVIYTSGSTGKPKGVMIEHRSIVNRIHWMQKKYPIDAQSTILQKTPFTFDVSVWELFWWSFAGAKVCMLEPGAEKDPRAIILAVEQNEVTTMHFVPSMLGAFLDYVDRNRAVGRLSAVKQVFASGEALTTAHADDFNRILFSKNGTQLYNLYGPTEAAVDVSYFDCSPRVTLKTVPIGKPIDNIRLYILDKKMTLLPIGIPGELYIGGVGVGRGYINNPVLTAEKFVDDPYNRGEKLYRTGDRARWFPQGDIEYLGRLDFQIKIRGFRIELGEIESKLMSLSHVKSAVVVGSTHNSTSFLSAYYSAETEIKASELKRHLSRDLPEYMIPTFFIYLANLPLSANGKIDRKALPEPVFTEKSDDEYTAPVSATQKGLASIWSLLLDIPRIGITEDFFDIGGDSLRAIKLVGEVQKRFNVELTIKDIFTSRTILKMSEKIDRGLSSGYLPIPLVPQSDFYPASSAQKRLYILRQIEGEGINYNLPGMMLIEGILDAEKLNRSLNTIIRRHESLRTSFGLADGIPVQKIHDHADFTVSYMEASEDEVNGIIQSFVRPFDLETAPLIRVVLIKQNDEKHILLFDMHHIISDGESINILIREFSDLYAGKELPEIVTQYKDYSAWQNSLIESGKLRKQEMFWLSKLSGELPALNLPADFPRPAKKSFAGDKTSLLLDKDVTAALNRLASETQMTIFMILLAVFNVLISRYSGQEDIIIGTPIAGRQHADVRNLIGMFVNTLAVRSFPDWEMPFSQFLLQVKTNLIESYENQDYPMELLVEKICTKRDLSRNPIFDIMFVYQNMNTSDIHAENLVFTPGELNAKTSKFDITLEACETADGILLNAEYCSNLFTKQTIDRMLSHFAGIVHEVLEDQDCKIGEIQMLSPREKEYLISVCNDSSAFYPENMTINKLFEEQCLKTPDHTALVFEGREITYGELNGKANSIAAALHSKGILPDDIVAVCAAPSIELIAGILGILKAGGAYLPMDPDFPDDRISFMFEDSRAKAMLTQNIYRDRFASFTDCMILDEDSHFREDPVNPVQVHGPQNLAYIIYTSGSTGKPKGVMIEHRNVVRLLFNSKFQFQFSGQDIWTLFHSACFDFSVWEMYGALLYGGKLIIIKKQTAKDTREFLKVLIREKVTVLNQTPAAFNNLILEEKSLEEHSLCLRYVVFGGDALRPAQLKSFHEQYPEAKLINMYGITETTVHVTYKEIGDEEISRGVSNIGKAIPTLNTFVVDRKMNLVPIGVPGELCVTGAGVGRGYLNNQELTAAKFCADPFSGHNRMYRSGDLAKVTADGDLEYLGRIDNQIKIRGYRIELGEIVSDILMHPQIKEALVITRTNQYEEKQLYAYFTSDSEIEFNNIKEFLERSLPQYMIPSFFIRVEKMPLNRNGKIDRDALPGCADAVKPGISYAAPESTTERILTDIWSQVLELAEIGIDDDFFTIGGDSLRAIKVISRIPREYENVTLVDLYNNPTIRKLALKIDECTESEENAILVRLTPKTQRTNTPVICFPYGGGNVISYRNLSDSASEYLPDFALYAVNLPGHDMGEEEEFLSVEESSKLVLEEIRKMKPAEVVLYGHCVGSAPLIETARLLEKEKINIRAIYIGGTFPPKYVGLYGGFADPWKLYSDEKIIEYLCSIGLPYSAFDIAGMGFIIKAFRHDTRAFYQYLHDFHTAGYLKLNTPVHCIVGEKDRVTRNYRVNYKKWLAYSSGVTLHVIPDAEHYFINSHSQELALIIKDQLAAPLESC